MNSAAPKTSPSERRRRQRRNEWRRGSAQIIGGLLILAALQFALLMNTLPVQLPAPPADKPPPVSARYGL